METPQKPPVCKKVFKSGVLYYTIIDYSFVPEGHPVLKPGWFPLKKYNSDHPLFQKELAELRKRQEANLKMKDATSYEFGKIRITI